MISLQTGILIAISLSQIGLKIDDWVHRQDREGNSIQAQLKETESLRVLREAHIASQLAEIKNELKEHRDTLMDLEARVVGNETRLSDASRAMDRRRHPKT